MVILTNLIFSVFWEGGLSAISEWGWGRILSLFLLIQAIFLIYFFIFIFRRINIRREVAKTLVEEEITPLIAERVIIPYMNKVPSELILTPVEELKAIIGNYRYRREELVKTLISFHKLFDGGVDEHIRKIYLDLGLNEFAERDLFARAIKKNILALNELEFFKVKSHRIVKRMMQLKSNKSEILRETINFYILNVLEVNLDHFINSLKHSLSQWERLQYYLLITNSTFPTIPSFSQWINADEDPTKVLLCAELSEHYHQVEASDAIYKVLENSSSPLQLKLINILGRIYADDQAKNLKDLFSKIENIDAKIEVLKAIGRTGSRGDIPFLLSTYREYKNGFLRKHALRSIYNIDESAIDQIVPTEPYEHVIINHIKNPLLKY